MSNIKAGSITGATSMADDTRVVIMSSDGNTVLNTNMAELVNYLSPLLGGGGASDQTPDAFTFNTITGAQLSIDINESNEITISGINMPINVTTTASYSKNGGTIQPAGSVIAINGDKFKLYVQSSDFPLTTTSGILTAGDVSATFSITTGDYLTPLSMLGQQIDKAWFQEDLNEGEVSDWLSRGRRAVHAVQATQANRPIRLPANGGVLFGNAAKKWLQWGNDTEVT